MCANTWEPPIDIISAKPTYSNMEIIYYIDADSIHCIALWSRHEANYVYSRRLALQFGRGSIFVFAKCIIGEAGALANFSAQGVAALPARIFFLLDRVLRAFLASASLASACVMAVVTKAVPQDKHLRLSQICATWRNGDLTEQGTQIITMADEALDILREVGWVTQRVLPNSAVDAL